VVATAQDQIMEYSVGDAYLQAGRLIDEKPHELANKR
jgi:hypothetical protein